MTRLVTGVCTFVFSSIGWYLGARLGVFAAFLLAVVGVGVGVFVGRQLADRWGA